MENGKWFALDISVDVRAAEAIEFALNELGSIGTEISSFGQNRVEEIEVIGYFSNKLTDEVVRAQLDEALRIYGFPPAAAKNFKWRAVADQDWLHEWKKHWKATETARFIIAPPWEELEAKDKIVVRIEPNMAFGTGTHETTRLCLRAIELHYRTGMSFLDVGTGTGILAIAAAKKFDKDGQDRQDLSRSVVGAPAVGAMPIGSRISACDTDEDSIRIARENAVLNGVGGIDFFVGSISGNTPPFDFVCANLTADTLLPLLPLLLEKARRVLVLSGILVEQEELVLERLRALGVDSFSVETDGEWIGITVGTKAA